MAPVFVPLLGGVALGGLGGGLTDGMAQYRGLDRDFAGHHAAKIWQAALGDLWLLVWPGMGARRRFTGRYAARIWLAALGGLCHAGMVGCGGTYARIGIRGVTA